jgi:hypothetical protein
MEDRGIRCYEFRKNKLPIFHEPYIGKILQKRGGIKIPDHLREKYDHDTIKLNDPKFLESFVLYVYPRYLQLTHYLYRPNSYWIGINSYHHCNL